MAKPVVGVYLDNTHLQVGRIENYKLVDQKKVSLGTNISPTSLASELKNSVEKLFDKSVSHIGFCHHTSNFSSKEKVSKNSYNSLDYKSHLKNKLESQFSVPVYAKNEAECFTVGEKYFGKAKKYKNVVGLILNSGLHVGIIAGNKLYSGSKLGSGNFGKISYLNKNYDHYCSDKFFRSQYKSSLQQIKERAEKGSKNSQAIFTRFGGHLAHCLTLMINILDPEIIVIGGEISGAHELFDQSLLEKLKSNYNSNETPTKIVFENRNDIDISLRGTAALHDIQQEEFALKLEQKERRKLERLLGQKSIILNSFLENIPDYMYVKDPDSRFIMNNKSHMDALGARTQDEVVGKTDFDFFPKNLAIKYFQDEQELIKSGKSLIDKEEQAINKSTGKSEWLSSTKVPILDDKGEKIGIVGITRDITDRKDAEEALKRSRNELEASKKETDNILENVQEGLFLITPDLIIGSQYSKSLETIFDQKNLAKLNISDLLKDKIQQKDVECLEEYLEAMFDHRIHELELEDLNPVSQIETEFKDKETGEPSHKYLTFRFKRITGSHEKITQLISTVSDVTTEVHLAEKLKNSEAYKKRQMDLMFSIMHVEPELLREFMDGTEKEINDISETLKSQIDKKDYTPVLEKIYRSVHMIKGNASLLDIGFFAEKAHEFEEKIEELKNFEEIKNTDFISLVFKLDDLQNLLTEMKNLISQFGQIQELFRPKRSHESKVLITSLQNFVKMTAKDLKKEVNLVHKKFDSSVIPFKYRILFKEILIQLIRNAIYHGIETIDERLKMKKPKVGKIEISTVTEDDMIKLIVRDDGRGIQIEKLKSLAQKSGNWTKKEIAEWDDKKTAKMILIQGISTSNQAWMVAGRGVGMSIITEKLANNDGKLTFDFKKEKFCEFSISLPNAV
jgi:PAS domain S-box-containing protein